VTDRRRIVLVRHGVTDWNREGRWQGQLDPPLSDSGRREASRVAGRVGGDPELRPVRIVSSTLARALETAVTEATVEWDGGPLSIGASIGFAMLGPSDELADALAKADHAMYARKAARKGGRLLP